MFSVLLQIIIFYFPGQHSPGPAGSVLAFEGSVRTARVHWLCSFTDAGPH